MLVCSDGQLLKIRDVQETLPVLEMLDKKKYRVGDAPLSYRQINELGNDELIRDERENERGWRKFSLKELLYFMVTVELKKLGVENARLRSLGKLFFEKNGKKGSRNSADDAICLAFGNVQVALMFDTRGGVGFYAQPFWESMGEHELSYVHVNLNRVISELLKRLGHDFDLSYKTMLDRFAEEAEKNNELTDKERELVNIVREGGCERIEFTMKDGKANVIRLTKVKRSEFSPGDLARMLDEKRYAKVTIQMEDGRVVVHEIEEKRKP